MRIGKKDVVSRIAARLEEQRQAWRERPLARRAIPTCSWMPHVSVKVNRGASVRSMALLTCVGVEEEGFREVLWRWGGGRYGEGRGVRLLAASGSPRPRPEGGLRLVISEEHEGIKAAVSGELSGVEWQRCVVHFERNVLAHVPANAM